VNIDQLDAGECNLGHMLQAKNGGLTAQLSARWQAPSEEQLLPTSIGLSGGLWSLPTDQRLDVPPLDHMRVIVNLYPLHRHTFWSEGRKLRSAASPAGALRIAPLHESVKAEVSGEAFRFAQIYIPRDALTAIDRPSPSQGATSVFRDPAFDTVDPLVTELVRTLLQAGSAPEAGLYRDHLALALLVHLDRTYADRVAGSVPAGALDPRRLRIAIARLQAAEETPSLAELSEAVGLSAHHFARSFRAATGLPPHRYLRKLRMAEAKRLLVTTSEPVTQIALACGYSTPSAFSAAFQRAVGVTPSVWRRRAR
jgi:AraC family transcriptional regulator